MKYTYYWYEEGVYPACVQTTKLYNSIAEIILDLSIELGTELFQYKDFDESKEIYDKKEYDFIEEENYINFIRKANVYKRYKTGFAGYYVIICLED